PDELYAQAVARSPDVAASEHAFPMRRSDDAVDDAASRARETGTAHHLYRNGMALVSTSHEPGAAAYYTVAPGGHWTRVPDPPGTGRFPPTARQLSALSSDPSQAAAQPADVPGQAAGAEPTPVSVPARPTGPSQHDPAPRPDGQEGTPSSPITAPPASDT